MLIYTPMEYVFSNTVLGCNLTLLGGVSKLVLECKNSTCTYACSSMLKYIKCYRENIHMHAAAYVKIHKIKEVQMLKISVNMLHSSNCPSHHISGTFCLSLRSNIRYAEEKTAVHAKDILQGVHL